MRVLEACDLIAINIYTHAEKTGQPITAGEV